MERMLFCIYQINTSPFWGLLVNSSITPENSAFYTLLIRFIYMNFAAIQILFKTQEPQHKNGNL